jgi:hypothetical protein
VGWSAGSELADDVWSLVREFIPPSARKRVAREVIGKFEDHDADDWGYGRLIEEDADLESGDLEEIEDE